ncbi:MAG TPA: 23S rRNA (pseudouridine(1915)-N(3))-methyltransferase RlmH [Gammaproteobacteria bacterium]|nr:23S rRNA (pseudouridine(1915)-N(3))-methyltransferase RlmH [Gammaproteobacteria bacterium]
MRIHLIAVGERMPDWVKSGYDEYAKRLPRECHLQLLEIPAGKRGKGANLARAIREEGERMLAALPKEAHVIALDMRGNQWDTPQLAQQLKDWLQDGHDVALLTGGPDGLAESCLKRADRLWSLSKLTLPHPLVRIVVAEQVYRAWSLLKGHPYHR